MTLPHSRSGRNGWPSLALLSPDEQHQQIAALYREGTLSDAQLWDVLSHASSPVTAATARVIYLSLGFEPFAGYPLVPLPSEAH
jgi:hypothetical protein